MAWNAKNGAVTVGGAEMPYVSFGHGARTLVVIPGLSDGLATVKGKALLLAAPYAPYFDRFTVYMFSRKVPLQSGCSIRDMASDQAEAMRALGIEKASVLGVSQGGMIAQYLAIDHPELMDKLVIAVSAPCANDMIRSNVEKWIDLTQRGDHKALMIDTAEKSYSPAYLKKIRKFYPFLGAFKKPAGYDRFLANAQAILDFDAGNELGKITCPTLIIGGEIDKNVGAAASRVMHEGIAGSELYIYPGLGHAPFDEAPKDFYSRVFRFLEAEGKQDSARSREEIVSSFYEQADEDTRLHRTRHGQLEYRTTMAYIHRYANEKSKVLEVGAGTGRYSVALAKEGMDVTAVELSESNLAALRENSRGRDHIRSFQGDATNLEQFADDTFDVTLVLGPMYHLYTPEEVNRAIDEAIRVTRRGGVILFAFISVYAIMYANYLYGKWAFGQEENFTEDYRVKHYKEQLFTGYDIAEFERLFEEKPVEWITTAGTDGMLEALEDRADFCIPDSDFDAFAAWYLTFAEKRELLGGTSHLLYICRKK